MTGLQTSIFDIYNGIITSMEDDQSKLIPFLEDNIDFISLIPPEFCDAFYKSCGRSHKYSLVSIIRMLVVQKLFNFYDKQLIQVLKISSDLRYFCRILSVPHSSLLTRFKQDYCKYLELLFNNLVNLTAPICHEIDKKKSKYLIFDTTGIEPCVKENNPKFLATKLREAKAVAKNDPTFNPYAGVYSFLPKTASANNSIKQQYVNGHFCYAQKAGVLTDGLGIIRHISLLDDDFKSLHPEAVSKMTDNPELDKEIGDSAALKAVLSDFKSLHQNLEFSTFIGDSAFDTYDNYSMLKNDFKFQRVCIPLNPRNSKTANSSFDEFGTPICPLDGTPFTFIGKSKGKNRSLRFKYVCHKSLPKGSTRVCCCETPCTTSKYGRCCYTYPDKDFRLYPGIPRNTEHFANLYRHRLNVERSINQFKNIFGLQKPRSHNSKTLKADLFLAGITQLIGVILADALFKKNIAENIPNKKHLFKSIRTVINKVA